MGELGKCLTTPLPRSLSNKFREFRRKCGTNLIENFRYIRAEHLTYSRTDVLMKIQVLKKASKSV